MSEYEVTVHDGEGNPLGYAKVPDSKGVLRRKGDAHRPASAIPVVNAPIETGHNLLEADYLYLTLSDVGLNGRTWPVAIIDLTTLRSQTVQSFYVWNYSNAYVTVNIVDWETGTLQPNDAVRAVEYNASFVI